MNDAKTFSELLEESLSFSVDKDLVVTWSGGQELPKVFIYPEELAGEE